MTVELKPPCTEPGRCEAEVDAAGFGVNRIKAVAHLGDPSSGGADGPRGCSGDPAVTLAVLSHEEDVLPLAAFGERAAHDFLRTSVLVVSRVFKNRHALVDRRVHDPDCLVLALGRADVPATKAENRDLLVRPA